jgi:hypothetical protein
MCLVVVHRLFDREQQIGRALHFVDGHAVRDRLFEQCLGIRCCQAAVERGVERYIRAPREWLDIADQRALARLACAREHHDGKEPKGLFDCRAE